MTALITLSHGSRHPEAVASVEALTRAAGDKTGVPAAAAHLEFSSPALGAAARNLAAQGVREAVVVPLLFTEGYHQRVDVPAALDSAAAESGLTLHRARGLGTGEDMAQLLAQRVPAGAQKVVVYSVGSSDARANAVVAQLARRVGELTGCAAEVSFATQPAPATAAGAAREVVVPLFVSPGLLLDRLIKPSDNDHASPHRTVLLPLGEALAGIVARRFKEVAHA
ncbi:sirohydrochlorin chelatase [Corynebacterium sp. YSMAA1_1_D6]|uniref:sirohydrochlorin chelatase n=1 Tax=Corynebacterium sp. YSMAA1_1_D6 TaxID=3383589 RepID=UPI0038CFDD18